MHKSDLVYFVHIQQSINHILEYTSKMDEAAFYQNQLVKDAVVRNFEIIGEATKQISNTIKEKYPNIEWKKMAGMRDKLIHDYIGVDYLIIWTTVQQILPDLKRKIHEIIQKEGK